MTSENKNPAKAANDFMRSLQISGVIGVRKLWSIGGPVDTAIKYIQAWQIRDGKTTRIVLVEVYQDSGFDVFPALNIVKTFNLSTALLELGEFESSYEGEG